MSSRVVAQAGRVQTAPVSASQRSIRLPIVVVIMRKIPYPSPESSTERARSSHPFAPSETISTRSICDSVTACTRP